MPLLGLSKDKYIELVEKGIVAEFCAISIGPSTQTLPYYMRSKAKELLGVRGTGKVTEAKKLYNVEWTKTTRIADAFPPFWDMDDNNPDAKKQARYWTQKKKTQTKSVDAIYPYWVICYAYQDYFLMKLNQMLRNTDPEDSQYKTKEYGGLTIQGFKQIVLDAMHTANTYNRNYKKDRRNKTQLITDLWMFYQYRKDENEIKIEDKSTV